MLSCVLFADDTTVYASGTDMVELARVFSSEIENISLWMRADALSLNVNKTYYMLFSNTRTLPPSDLQIILDGMNVRREQNCKFLGINIDTKLNFKFHISHVRGKIARSVGIFYRLQYYFPRKILVNLYYLLVYPYLLYFIISWGVLIPVALLL